MSNGRSRILREQRKAKAEAGYPDSQNLGEQLKGGEPSFDSSRLWLNTNKGVIEVPVVPSQAGEHAPPVWMQPGPPKAEGG